MNNLDVDKLKLRVSLSGAVTTDTDDLQPSSRLASYKYIPVGGIKSTHA